MQRIALEKIFNRQPSKAIEADDGLVFLRDTSVLRSTDFASETAMADYIERFIQLFTIDTIGDKLKTYQREFYVSRKTKQRADFMLDCEGGKYIVEVKNPKGIAENRSAIGQLLSYGTETSDEYELVLVTTMFDKVTADTIRNYKLPIRYIYFSKAQNAEVVQ